MTNYFNRSVTTEFNVTKHVAAAYKAVGKTGPDNGDAVIAKINAIPSPDQVAQTLVIESLDATDADVFYADALERYRNAEAATNFKAAFNNYASTVTPERVKRARTAASDALQTDYDAVATALVTAAADLPEQPLDLQAVVAADATVAFKATGVALTKLAAYASMFMSVRVDPIPPALQNVLQVIELPTAVVEQRNPMGDGSAPAPNEALLEGTRTIRRLAQDLRTDTDTALVNVARGRYEGVTIVVQPPSATAAARANATKAFERVTTV